MTMMILMIHIKSRRLGVIFLIFSRESELIKSKMDLLVKILKCPFCESFSTTSTDTFLRHLREHKCDSCKKHHRSKGWLAFCRNAKKYPVTINCCFPRCSMKFTTVTELTSHLSEYHGKCVICNKYTCQCFHGKFQESGKY